METGSQALHHKAESRKCETYISYNKKRPGKSEPFFNMFSEK